MSIKETFLGLSLAKRVAVVAIPLVLAGGGVTTGVVIHNNNVAKEQQLEQEKEQERITVLSENKKNYKTAKMQLENRILSDEDRTSALEELSSYKDKILDETLTVAEQTDFGALVVSIQEAYDADAKTLADTYAGLAGKYPADENGYYSDEFKTTLTGLTEEYNTFVSAGQYQNAYNKLVEMDTTYATYVGENTEDAAETESKTESSNSGSSSKKNNTSNGNAASNSNNEAASVDTSDKDIADSQINKVGHLEGTDIYFNSEATYNAAIQEARDSHSYDNLFNAYSVKPYSEVIQNCYKNDFTKYGYGVIYAANFGFSSQMFYIN